MLVNGKIPANTECPFRDTCKIAKEENCLHQGVLHEVEFSCAVARLLTLEPDK